MEQFPDVDAYLARSNRWPDEIRVLRPVLLGAGLTEGIKWGKPCYTHGGKNVVIVQEFNDHLALLFFKGALLEDPAGVLVEQGPNSRAARRIEFKSVDDVERLSNMVAAYLSAAIAVEDEGRGLPDSPDLELVIELAERLASDPALEAAFESLTPGRQRQYNLYFGDAKRTETRTGRVEKCVPRILEGKGLRDR